MNKINKQHFNFKVKFLSLILTAIFIMGILPINIFAAQQTLSSPMLYSPSVGFTSFNDGYFFVGYADAVQYTGSGYTIEWEDVGADYYVVYIKQLSNSPDPGSSESGTLLNSHTKFVSTSYYLSESDMSNAVGSWIKVSLQAMMVNGDYSLRADYYFYVNPAETNSGGSNSNQNYAEPDFEDYTPYFSSYPDDMTIMLGNSFEFPQYIYSEGTITTVNIGIAGPNDYGVLAENLRAENLRKWRYTIADIGSFTPTIPGVYRVRYDIKTREGDDLTGVFQYITVIGEDIVNTEPIMPDWSNMPPAMPDDWNSNVVDVVDIVDQTKFEEAKARAEEIMQVQWTPLANINTWNGNTVPYSAGDSAVYEKGATFFGLPYSQPATGSGKFILRGSVTVDTFLKAIADKNNSIYKNTYSTVTRNGKRTGPLYGTECSTFVSYVINLTDIKAKSSKIKNTYATTVEFNTYANDSGNKEFYFVKDWNQIKPGDLINYSGSHMRFVIDVIRDSNGNVTKVTTYEQACYFKAVTYGEVSGYTNTYEATYNVSALKSTYKIIRVSDINGYQ